MLYLIHLFVSVKCRKLFLKQFQMERGGMQWESGDKKEVRRIQSRFLWFQFAFKYIDCSCKGYMEQTVKFHTYIRVSSIWCFWYSLWYTLPLLCLKYNYGDKTKIDFEQVKSGIEQRLNINLWWKSELEQNPYFHIALQLPNRPHRNSGILWRKNEKVGQKFFNFTDHIFSNHFL